MPVEDRVVVHGGGVVNLFEEPLDVDRTLGSLLPRVDGGHTSLGNDSPSRYCERRYFALPRIVVVRGSLRGPMGARYLEQQKTIAYSTNASSRFASIVHDGVLEPPRLARHT